MAEKEMIQETVLTAFYYQIEILSWTQRSSQDHITGSYQRIMSEDHNTGSYQRKKQKILKGMGTFIGLKKSHDEVILFDCLILWVDGIQPREPINMDPTLTQRLSVL